MFHFRDSSGHARHSFTCGCIWLYLHSFITPTSTFMQPRGVRSPACPASSTSSSRCRLRCHRLVLCWSIIGRQGPPMSNNVHQRSVHLSPSAPKRCNHSAGRFSEEFQGRTMQKSHSAVDLGCRSSVAFESTFVSFLSPFPCLFFFSSDSPSNSPSDYRSLIQIWTHCLQQH